MSVLAAMKSTPSRLDSIIVLMALPPPPPTPMTLILARFVGSSSNSRSAIRSPPQGGVHSPSMRWGVQIFCRSFFSREMRGNGSVLVGQVHQNEPGRHDLAGADGEQGTAGGEQLVFVVEGRDAGHRVTGVELIEEQAHRV